MEKAIIIGASSGIGRELAILLAEKGYALGLAARRTDLLDELGRELHGKAHTVYMDIADPDSIDRPFNELLSSMNGADLVVISAGTGYVNHELNWDIEKVTVDVNVTGFMKAMNCAVRYFQKKGTGHIVGISSIAALRGGSESPAYNASKAFVSNYMEGIRCMLAKSGSDVTVTDVRPGLVDTAMAKGEGLFWLIPPRVAAECIYRAVGKKRRVQYFTARWRLVAALLSILPERIYRKL
ncbi:MAG TPA: SDR family NAD(P)-dependent oxidoreductase [Spirochaetota bacterium]|nr:SDR family NAD(P)-dependent oxidoreductase [Spirochaetota bacterium]